jgi:eukaryotic-like serine/threonine-protein kinase
VSHDPLEPGGALSGRLFEGFLKQLAKTREPETGDRVGPWKICSELGRGGSGVVYLAERDDGAFSQRVALKWLRGDRPVPGGREVLARERELLAGLDHPNIARIIDGGHSEDGQIWFAMEYVDGQSVDARAASLDLKEKLRLVHTLCRAVHHAHSRRLIHGDVKPANILVDRRGQPRLLDFGIARFEGKAARESYGLTPDFASPEQARGEELTTASDVWQLGRLLEELMCEQPIPADLQAILNRAMAEDPDARYASAAAMAGDLEAWMGGYAVSAHSGSVFYRLRRLVGRHQAASMTAAVSLLIMFAGGAWMTWQLAEERDKARQQAERAESALIETEAALARAERLQEFLIGLFQANRPDRPPDELPSTAEILERGALQALDSDIAPASVRFGMLSAIGQVYLAQRRYEQARPLIEEAARLAGKNAQGLRPQDYSLALTRQADLMVRAGDDLDQAKGLLLEAERMLPEDRLTDLIQIRISRTWIERHRGRHDQALELIEPLIESVKADPMVSPARRASLFDAVSGLQAAGGQLEAAAFHRQLAIQAVREAHGEDSHNHAVTLANSVGLETTLGNFDEAERRARSALALYDRIHEEPNDFRAAVRSSLSNLLLVRGQIDGALVKLEQAATEQAASRGVEPQEWPLLFSRRATVHTRLGDLEQASRDMHRAHELLNEQGGFDQRLVDTMDMLLAWIQCRHGQADSGGERLLALGEARNLQGRSRNRAQWLEANATCAHANGEHAEALTHIRRALDMTEAPGAVIERVDRGLLKARILAADGQIETARNWLDLLSKDLDTLGLDDHPLKARIARVDTTLGRPVE